MFNWLDRAGPFVDDDKLHEEDDYFEFADLEVTATGLGEAARRTKASEDCASYSFEGGEIDFAVDPLEVDHGLREERYGRYPVRNHWRPEALIQHAISSGPPVNSWPVLVEVARTRFPHLDIADLHANATLAREPFEASVRDKALTLMGLLNTYMAGRRDDGAEGPVSKEVIEAHFKGERAYFTGESTSNENKFRREMTFVGRDGREIFAPWHGKISHRFFRIHFEWPLAPEHRRLPILYLGPKITKG
ncbi:hypothetical protein [Sandaracinobacteroides hominis]|uniref:hypothetical protein n=1 Tax=Sandaracinobacteroides hominis TaxID=2780086 RepID=UPI0018F4FD7D|nr:hypothetical protein [Sandaracinobacteroides hominis]